MEIIIILLQIVSVILCTTGIVIEYYYEAHWGFVLITGAALIFALATKLFELKLYDENKRLRRINNRGRLDKYL